MTGFSFPKREKLNLRQLRLQEEHLEFDYCETSDEEEHFTQGAVTESELVNLRMLLDEEEKLEQLTPESQSKEELDAITRVNVKAMRLCEALEAAEANRRAEAGDLDSLRWFQLCRLVESGEQHGVEELLRNLEATSTSGVYSQAWRSTRKCGGLEEGHPEGSGGVDQLRGPRKAECG